MGLLSDIISEASDSDSDVAGMLRKCRILVSRISGPGELEEWIRFELNGYPPGSNVPEYRLWSVNWKGNFVGPFQSGLKNAPIHSTFLPEAIREDLKRFRNRDSVAALQSLLGKSDSGLLIIPFNDLALAVGSAGYQGMQCAQSWGEVSAGAAVETLNAVRNRTLEFALAIEKRDPNAGHAAGLKPKLEAKAVKQIFNTTIQQGSANITAPSGQSTATVTVTQNWSTLERQLADANVDAKAIAELKAALAKDETARKPGEMGPATAGWLSKLVGAAAKGVGQVSVNSASILIPRMIMAFLGMPT